MRSVFGTVVRARDRASLLEPGSGEITVDDRAARVVATTAAPAPAGTPDGDVEGWVVVVPEPATGPLVVAGLALLSLRRKLHGRTAHSACSRAPARRR